MLRAARMPEIALEPRPGDSVGPYRITRIIGRGRMGDRLRGHRGRRRAGRDQGRHDRALAGRGVRAPLPARGRRRPRRSTHPNVVPVLGARRGGRAALPRAGADPGRLAGRPDRRPRAGSSWPTTVAAAERRRRGDRRAARRRARAPRHQAGEHPARRRHAPTCPTSGWPRTARPRTSRGPGQALGSLDYMAPEQIRGEDVSAGHRHLRARLRDPRVPDRHAAVRRAPEHARAVRAPAGAAAGPLGRCGRTSRRPRRAPINRALEKEPEDRPASAAAYVTGVARAAGL